MKILFFFFVILSFFNIIEIIGSKDLEEKSFNGLNHSEEKYEDLDDISQKKLIESLMVNVENEDNDEKNINKYNIFNYILKASLDLLLIKPIATILNYNS
ncbi:hypothetical protein PFLG_01822 [Plasmodium falciparum RAJ116]|uniref:Uncharacterized protein n=3 Tax=Plasmodium falciparum TaxID=5833 RepID=A0A0L0CYN3_PLAFA|nr:hypothetical protein PFFVO_00643 [Plasmodium falciparum Vietnam Oak-Knoll (FVO)]ETW44931.1 hypothetical protein PFNF135_00706 [Plasmodium falciparum NF135/5.C10]KNC36479.1 hypothetical protein PFLG_01822 [Plasmodium falciparum RAJ116]